MNPEPSFRYDPESDETTAAAESPFEGVAARDDVGADPGALLMAFIIFAPFTVVLGATIAYRKLRAWVGEKR